MRKQIRFGFAALMLVLLFSAVNAASISYLDLRNSPQNVVYVNELSDDDGTIAYVDVFYVDVLGSVSRFSFEAVGPGDTLFDLGAETVVGGLYYDYMDVDGSQQNLANSIWIEGDIVPCLDCPTVVQAIKTRKVVPRINADETGYDVDVWAEIFPDYAPVSVGHQTGACPDRPSVSCGENFDGLLSEFPVGSGFWSGTIGSFTAEQYFYSSFRPSGGPLPPNTAYHLAWAAPAWAHFTKCDDSGLGILMPSQEPVQGDVLLFDGPAGSSDMQMSENQHGDVWVSSVTDDDDDIEVVSVHVINGGVDKERVLENAKVGDRIDGFIDPPGAIAYYNFVDFDGAQINMAVQRGFMFEWVSKPSYRIFESISLTPVMSSDGLAYKLRVDATVKDEYSPTKLDLYYTLTESGNSFVLPMIKTGAKTYLAELGPFDGYTGIYVRLSPESPSDEYGYSTDGYVVRDYYLVKTSNCNQVWVPNCDDPDYAEAHPECGDPVVEYCFNEIDDDGDGLIDEADCVMPEDDEYEKERDKLREQLEDRNADKWVLKIKDERILVGEEQQIWVENPETGGRVANVDVFITKEQEEALSTGDSGLLDYKVKSEGLYTVFALQGAFNAQEAFRGLVLLTSVVDYFGEGAALMFSSRAFDSPLLLLLLLSLAIIVALLSYDRSRLLFDERVKSTKEKRRESAVRAGVAILFFAVPLLLGLALAVYLGLIMALGEIAAIFLGDYFIRKSREKKPIRV